MANGPESLSLLLVLAGCLALRYASGIAGGMLAAFPMAAACFTHPAGLWFAIAALFHLAEHDRRRLAAFAASLALLVGFVHAGLSVQLGPWFNFYAWDISLRALQLDPIALVRYLGRQLLGIWGVLALATVLSCAMPVRPWRGAVGIWTWMGLAALDIERILPQARRRQGHRGPDLGPAGDPAPGDVAGLEPGGGASGRHGGPGVAVPRTAGPSPARLVTRPCGHGAGNTRVSRSRPRCSLPFRPQGVTMLLIREIMYCKPGKVRSLVEKFVAMSKLSEKSGMGKMRVMTDLSAERYWTVVSEMEVGSLKAFEEMFQGMGQSESDQKEFENIMKGYHDLVDHGRREIYKIEA